MSKVNFLVGNVSSFAQKFLVESLQKDYFVGLKYYDRIDDAGFSTRHARIYCYSDKSDLIDREERVEKFDVVFDKLPSPTPVNDDLFSDQNKLPF